MHLFVNCRQVSVLRPNCHMWLVIYKMFSFYKLAVIQSLKVQLEDDVKRRTQDNHYFMLYYLKMLLSMIFVCFLVRMVDADNFLMLFNPFSQSHIFHLLPVTKELLRYELQGTNKRWCPSSLQELW